MGMFSIPFHYWIIILVEINFHSCIIYRFLRRNGKKLYIKRWPRKRMVEGMELTMIIEKFTIKFAHPSLTDHQVKGK